MNSERLSTGVPGLDAVLDGGLVSGQSYMVRGDSGTGKTILGQQFLLAGLEAGERALYVAFEERPEAIRTRAATLGFDLSGVEFLDLTAEPDLFVEDDTYSVFTTSEVEGKPIAEEIAEAVERVDPDRVFLDPLTRLRHVAPDDHQFHRLVSSMMRYLTDRGVTSVFSTQSTQRSPDDDLQYLGDGTVELLDTDRGRSVRVTKFRGSGFEKGPHALTIGEGGVDVFPKLVPGDHDAAFEPKQLSTGNEGLDALLHGGIDRGSITLISGPSGVGKSTTGSLFLQAAADRGENAAGFLFEEPTESFRHRAESLGIGLGDAVADDRLRLHSLEPLRLSTDEFSNLVREEVEAHDIEVVLIDGTAGYRLSLHNEEEDLVGELHALCRYLRNMGVTVLVTEELHDIEGTFRASDSHVSYLADTILFLRYAERNGRMEKEIGVMKRRLGGFDPTIHSLVVDDDGYRVGDPIATDSEGGSRS
ncbi:ATPase domain-containing protein [Halorarius halobius]|uniref:ATPase domain-containing protein n=1 Tax=Halorarius halobius TaxID=2962671 RepID=UPI0020CE0375|nr:ATPase domain-containing protein [Halorarius halobius]